MDLSANEQDERCAKLMEAHVAQWCETLPDSALYAPMAYLMRLPAKRVRPTLVLMACELFGGRAEDALDAALGIEIFHNFTLMHDDIMDDAPFRRGSATVHVKWNINTAILSGDAMLVKAYQAIGTRPDVLALFSACALEVCEGQQRDMEFELRDDVTLDEYMAMIHQKTAALLSCALRIGATIAGASEADQARIGAFGEHMGLAFQLRDDLLDAFGDARTGKEVGGDLRAGKKTFLLIRGLERETEEGSTGLREQLVRASEERDVPSMKIRLGELGIPAEAEAMIKHHERAAHVALSSMGVPEERKMALRVLSAALMERVR